MSELAPSPEEAVPEGGFRARHALLKRLADVVSLPASRINAFERAVTGDLLVEMLRLASPEDRRRVAARLAPLAELPNALARMLLRYPLVTQKTIAAIHWHALHLWRRGIRFHRHGAAAR